MPVGEHAPPLPCHAVIFVSQRTEGDAGYGAMAKQMAELASQQPGYLAMHSARDTTGKGITVVFFDTPESARAWGRHPEHRVAQERGKAEWYAGFELYYAQVERARLWTAPTADA